MTLGTLDTRPRLLIVEDIETTRNSYLDNFDLEERYTVDAVESLAQAIEILNRRSYHVALVDIMLAGEADIANRDGAKVVERIQEMNEGTQVVVLSAQKETQLVRQLLKELEAFDYLDKRSVSAEGFSLISSTVRRAVDASNAEVTPTWDVVVEALGGGARTESELVAKAMKCLDFSGGFENLSRTLMSGLKHLVPLLPRKGDTSGLCLNDEMKELGATFWSKGQGRPVELRLTGRNSLRATSGATDDTAGENVLVDREKGGLRLWVGEVPKIERNEFVAQKLMS